MLNQERDRLHQEILEYRFGCHSDPESFRQRLESDPELQHLYQEMADTAGLIQLAAQEESPALSLPQVEAAGNAPFLHRLRWAALWLFLLLCASFFTPYLKSAWQHWQSSRSFLSLEVRGPAALPDTAGGSFEIRPKDFEGEATEADLSWTAFDRAGQVMAEGRQTGVQLASLEIPPKLLGAGRLEITARSAAGEQRQTIRLDHPSSALLVHLSTDKPIYRPGETVYWRVVGLDRFSLSPIPVGSLPIQIFDGKDTSLVNRSIRLNEKGVESQAFGLAPDADGGEYRIAVRDPGNQFDLASLNFIVRPFQAPKLRKQVDLDRESYRPGDTAYADFQVAILNGQPAAEAQVVAGFRIAGEEVWQQEATCNAEGRILFQVPLPQETDQTEGRLTFRVEHQGRLENYAETVLIEQDDFEVHFFPEGGDLIADVDQRVYFEILDRGGRPMQGSGQIVDQQGQTVARWQSEHQGRGRFRIKPQRDQHYRLVMDGRPDRAFPLPTGKADGSVLEALQDGFGPEEALRFRVQNHSNGTWHLAAFQRGRLLAEESFSGAGIRTLELKPRAAVSGVLRVTLFDEHWNPVAERLIHRRPAQYLQVQIRNGKSVLAPGERQNLEIRTFDETGKAIPAVVGLCVSNFGVREMADQIRIGLADQAWLFEEVGSTLDPEDFLASDPESTRNIDLLLATRGWRRFLWTRSEALTADQEPVDEEAWLALQARSGRGSDKTWKSEGTRKIRRELRALERNQGRKLTQAIAFSVLLLLPFLLGQFFLSSYYRRLWRHWGPASFGRIASLGSGALVTFLWLALPFYFYSQTNSLVPGADAAPATMEGMLEALGYSNLEEPVEAELMTLGYSDGEESWGWEAEDALEEEGELEEIEFEDAPIPEETEEQNLVSALGYVSLDDVDQNASATRHRNGWLRVRSYAYAAERSTERSDFRDTLFWDGAIETDAQGFARVSFDIGDHLTTWEAWADAHGQQRLGQGSVQFESRLPLSIEPVIPPELTQGDRIELPIRLATSQLAQGDLHFQAQSSGAWQLTGTAEQIFPVSKFRNQAVRHYLPLEVDSDQTEAAELQLQLQQGRLQDRWKGQVRVVPRGFPHRLAKAGNLGPEEVARFRVSIPESLTPGSLRGSLKLYPSLLGTLADGMEGLLQEPHGCFEQTSATHYPNVLTLAFLESSGEVAPAIRKRALAYLDRGYRRLVGFECERLGFEWYGKDPGHGSLSAFGLHEFQDMVSVYDGVDPELLARTRQWLLDRRLEHGGFQPDHARFSFGSAPQAIHDAYTAWALAAAGTDPETLAPTLAWLQPRLQASQDPYEVALLTLAFHESGNPGYAGQGRKRLLPWQKEQGWLQGSHTSFTGSLNLNLKIETTALAILAWLGSEEYRAPASSAVEWLLQQRQGNGSFGATQATILALKALTAYQQQERQIVQPAHIRLFVNQKPVESLRLFGGEQEAVILEKLERHLGPGVHQVEIRQEGPNQLPWTLDLRYFAEQPATHPDAPLRLQTRLQGEQWQEGEAVELEVELENLSEQGLAMTMAIVGLPGNLEAPTQHLQELENQGAFDAWEIRGRELIFYWRGMAPKQNHRFRLGLWARIAGVCTGPASRAYLYYSPQEIYWTPPLLARVSPRR
ncbi:MAG: hypothetical protein DWQ01_21285 [Planctomycetota bacterium]|nr:MAG: hypothetical protein DWQ01_21285 [Planctomycetota bacterium]